MTEFTYPTDTLETKQDLLIHSPNSTLTAEYIPTNSYSERYLESCLNPDSRSDPRTVNKMKAFIKSYYSCDSFLPPLDLTKVAEYSCSGILSKDDLKRFFHPDIAHHGSDTEASGENDIETGADLAANLLVQAKILHQRALISEDKAKVVEQELADANLELKKTSQRYQLLNASHQEMRDQFWDLELHIQGLNSQIHDLISTNKNLTEENQVISRRLAAAMENLTEIKDRETELMEALDAGMKKYDQDTSELHRTILKMHEDINLLERQSFSFKSPQLDPKLEFQLKTNHDKNLDYTTNYYRSDKNKDYHSIYSTSNHEIATDYRPSFNKTGIDRSPEYNSGCSSPSQEKNPSSTYSKYTSGGLYERSSSTPLTSLPEESHKMSPSQPSYSAKHETALHSPELLEHTDSVQPLQNLGRYHSLHLSPQTSHSKEHYLFRSGSLADSGYDGSHSHDNSFSYESDKFHPALQSSDDETSSAIRPRRATSGRQQIRLSESILQRTSSQSRSYQNKVTLPQHECPTRPATCPKISTEHHRNDDRQKLPGLPDNKIKEKRPVDRSNSQPSKIPSYHIRTYHIPNRRKAKGLNSNWEILSKELNEPNSRKLASRVFDLGDRVLVQEILKGNGTDSDQEEDSEEEVDGEDLVEEECIDKIEEEVLEDKEEVISIHSLPLPSKAVANPVANPVALPVPSLVPNLVSSQLTSESSVLSLRKALNTVPYPTNHLSQMDPVSGLNPLPPTSLVKSASLASPLKSIHLAVDSTPFGSNGYLSDSAQAVQHVMVGEFLYKSSRTMLGQEKRALKFVWLNPQAKYLYWCDVDPGTQRTLFMDPSRPRSGAKSAFISSVRLISDGWVPAIPSGGVSPYSIEQFPSLSIVIDSPRISIKLKARSETSHKLWETALFYLQSTVPTLLTSQLTTARDSVSSGAASLKHGRNSAPVGYVPESSLVIQGIQRGHFVPSSAKQNRMSMLSPRGTW